MRRLLYPLLLASIACGPFFYQAPPTLGSYPERVAAKRWHHLFTEVAPPEPALPGPAELDENCSRLPDTLGPLSPAGRFNEIDRLLQENRRGPYSSQRANFLHELREIAADTELLAAAKPYIEWRVHHDSQLGPKPPGQRPWDMNERDFAELRALHQAQMKQRLESLQENLADSPVQLRPYWQTRLAAFLFITAEHHAAAEEFSAVMATFPGHPRAEVANLMLARCKIEESRSLRKQADPAAANTRDANIQDLLGAAESILQDFITRHPQGRFTPDAEGWLGAIAWDRGQLGAAARHQITRLELQPTREITRSVLRECDGIFEELLQSKATQRGEVRLNPDEHFDASAVASQPIITRLFLQHCIDPAVQISLPLWWDDGYSGSRATIDFLKRRILNPKPFVQIALNSLGREMMKSCSSPDATTLTLLAWAATENDEHEQALALLEMIPPGATNDEVLLARAIVLQRLSRHLDAVTAFDALATRFPHSPLVRDISYRRAISHFKSGQSGKAILDIIPLVFTEGKTRPTALHPGSQLGQWFDTLIQFSPLEELESAFADLPADSRASQMLRGMIRARALARHDFKLAGRYLDQTERASAPAWEWPSRPFHDRQAMSLESWEKHVLPLSELYASLEKSPSVEEQRRLHLAIARHWMENRGALTLPSLGIGYYAQSEAEKQDILRRKNAIGIGFSRRSVEFELDHRDEATHALEHAMKASESSDPTVAAPALELANQCLFRLAEFSLYQNSRALEALASRQSEDIHESLRRRFPDTPEGGRAVYFAFAPESLDWMPGDRNHANAASAAIRAVFDETGEDGNNPWPQFQKLLTQCENPPLNTTLPSIRRDLAAAEREFEKIRINSNPEDQWEIVRMIDRLDDLKAAAGLPGVTPKDYRNYAQRDFLNLPPAFGSLLLFREILNPDKDSGGYDHGRKNDTIATWREFLRRYPQSPKAEAASFRLTRMFARQFRSELKIAAIRFPDAPIPGGYKHLKVLRNDPLNNSTAVIAAIHEHETRFPAGRYSDDLKLLECGALIDAGNPREALVLLTSILNNPVQRDLHGQSVLQFMDISQRLLDPEQRLAVAKAFRDTPGSTTILRKLVDGDTFLSRLRPLMQWLESAD